MNTAIAHRGPDGAGVHVEDGVALGHRRLAILDLSPTGAQPMYNEDASLVLVFNGEIYNYLELIPELRARGHVFRSRSDSEVILHAYEEWGEACVERFNGMWAFAIWDVKRRRLFASRDRFGVKPFLYMHRAGELVFSSEIAGIRAVRPVTEANLGKLHDYLAYSYRTNNSETFFAGIHDLPPAHNLVFEAGRVRLTRYWALPEGTQLAGSEEELAQRFRELLTDAVRLRFRSDVPVALLQSGGLDSSAIARVVDDEIEAGRLGFAEVTAYTAVHPGDEYDESAKVRALIASCRHIRSVEVQTGGESLAAHLPDFVRAMGEPLFSTTAFAHWMIMRAIRDRGTKVVINGQGSDEAFGGYGRYILGYRLLDLLLRRPLRLPGEARAIHRRMGYGYPMIAAQFGKALIGRRLASRMRAGRVERSLEMLAPEFRREYRRYLPDHPMRFTPRNLDSHLRAQLTHYGFNQILHYEDQSSMSQSIEIRSPFIDYRLMEFAFGLPDEYKFSDGITKRILRRAFAGRLPSVILDDHSKIGFATPFDKWLAAPSMQSLVHDLVASGQFAGRGIWRADRLRARFATPHGAAEPFPAWRFLNVELWARQFNISNL